MDLGRFRHSSDVDEEAWAEWLGTDKVGKSEKASKQSLKPASTSNKHGASRQVPRRKMDGFEVPVPSHKPLPKKSSHEGGANTQPTISIQIHMPHIKRPSLPTVSWRKVRPWVIGAVLTALLLVGGKVVQSQVSKQKPTPQKAPVIASAELGYKPLTPPAKTNGQTSAAPKPSYNEKKGLYTFFDDYKGARVTVDQQAVPGKLKDNDAEIKKLADAMHTTDSFTTTLGKVYVYTSENGGAQRMFLVTAKMLMFVQSTTTLANSDWVAYIESLE